MKTKLDEIIEALRVYGTEKEIVNFNVTKINGELNEVGYYNSIGRLSDWVKKNDTASWNSTKYEYILNYFNLQSNASLCHFYPIIIFEEEDDEQVTFTHYEHLDGYKKLPTYFRKKTSVQEAINIIYRFIPIDEFNKIYNEYLSLNGRKTKKKYRDTIMRNFYIKCSDEYIKWLKDTDIIIKMKE